MNKEGIDQKMLKTVLEEMLAERNPALRSTLEELIIKILSAQQHTDRAATLDMQEIRRRYAIKRETFTPLHEIFKDAPPASEMLKHIRK